jgi:hypothetical protein
MPVIERRDPLGERKSQARAAFVAGVLLILGLAGCASEFTSRPALPSADDSPFVGVFTGEFVDGKPLYRFPAIRIVGSPGSIAPGS